MQSRRGHRTRCSPKRIRATSRRLRRGVPADMATAALRTPRLESSRLRRLLSARNLIVLGVAAVIAYLAAVPLGFLLWETFVKDGSLSFEAFRRAYTEVGLGRMAVNSLVFAVGSSAISILLGTVL